MMMEPTMDETGLNFLTRLYEETHGDVSVQVSMYDIGQSIGLDRIAASKTAEELIGLDMVQILTLSGGIGITDAGVSEIAGLSGNGPANAPSLGTDTVMPTNIIEVVTRLAAEIKGDTGRLGLEFDQLNELVADIKTIETQLTSTRPKTAIVRECFRSLKDLLARTSATDTTAQVVALLQE